MRVGLPLPFGPDALRAALLSWYDANARSLPWRIGPAERALGVRPDPYRVWLSEIMLQQTTVPHATPYFLDFTRRWPTVEALADADAGELMAAWAGLGYYARARNLHACAQALAAEHGGVFPDTEAGLRRLPGVGGYTAAAVAAIAFDRPANVVEGNVERVVSRLFAVESPLPDSKPELTRLAGSLLTGAAASRPGDWAQALMDLGATICRPKVPLCGRCPIAAFCVARATGRPDCYPLKRDKAARPVRVGVAYVVLRGGKVALERRRPKGLLGGMLGLPTTAWSDAEAVSQTSSEFAGSVTDWQALGEIRHVFTHFDLRLTVLRAEGEPTDPGLIWTPLAEAAQVLPTVFRKALARAVSLI